jgi:hypothetical protein
MDRTGTGLNDRRADVAVRRHTRPVTRGGLLDGILADVSGLPMLSTHSARPRFYIAIPLGDVQPVVARVPIVSLDKLVERLLRRMRVLPAGFQDHDVFAVLRRVELSDTLMTLELDRARSLANWRRQGSSFEKTSEREIVRALRRTLPADAALTSRRDALMVQAPRLT